MFKIVSTKECQFLKEAVTLVEMEKTQETQRKGKKGF